MNRQQRRIEARGTRAAGKFFSDAIIEAGFFGSPASLAAMKTARSGKQDDYKEMVAALDTMDGTEKDAIFLKMREHAARAPRLFEKYAMKGLL